MTLTTIESLKARLQEMKGDWPIVAAGAKVPVSTVRKIAQGHTKNPRIHTVDRLIGWLDSQ